jgi:hypothetical protein
MVEAVKPIVREFLGGDLREHEAVRAWRHFDPGCTAPGCIEVLKYKLKTAVYRLTGSGPGRAAVIAKKCRMETARVEWLIYEELLPRLPVPALQCYGFLEEPDSEFCWLFLEDAGGERYSPAVAKHRALAGRWLGEAHTTVLPEDLKERLPDRSLKHYRRSLEHCRDTLREHLDRNRALTEESAVVFRAVAEHCDVIAAHWAQIEGACQQMPRSLVQGDFVIKNMRIRQGARGAELLVYDWELSGWGLPGTDLAQFVGKVASPDLEVYCDVLKQCHRGLSVEQIQGVAACGNVLRLLDDVHWELTLLEFDSPMYLLKPVQALQAYEPRLVKMLNALKWS